MIGFSLVELMLACSLGGMVVVMAVSLFSLALTQEKEVRLQTQSLEQMRFACFFLRNKIQGAVAVQPILNRPWGIGIGNDAFAVYSLSEPEKKIFHYVSSVRTAGSKKEFALYIKEEGKPRIEIARGIRQMSILYGISCADSTNICLYLPGPLVKDFCKVKSLLISLFFDQMAKPLTIYISLSSVIRRPSFGVCGITQGLGKQN